VILKELRGHHRNVGLKSKGEEGMKLTQEEKMLAEQDVQERFGTEPQGGLMFFKGMWVGSVDGKTGEILWLPEEEQLPVEELMGRFKKALGFEEEEQLPVEELMRRFKKALEFEEVKKELHKAYDERMAELFRNGRKHTHKVKQLDSKLKRLLHKAGLEEYRFVHPDAVNVLRPDGTITEYSIPEQQYFN
jgi:hypothetical protein